MYCRCTHLADTYDSSSRLGKFKKMTRVRTHVYLDRYNGGPFFEFFQISVHTNCVLGVTLLTLSPHSLYACRSSSGC